MAPPRQSLIDEVRRYPGGWIGLLLLVAVLSFCAFSFRPHKKPLPESAAQNGDGRSCDSSVDFQPYMRALQRQIRKHWRPPTSESYSKNVVMFKIGRTGNLISPATIKESSGSEEHKAAALRAIQESSPFAPLPKRFCDEDVTSQFTFEYKPRSW